MSMMTAAVRGEDSLDVGVTVGRARVATAMMQTNRFDDVPALDLGVTVGRARVATAMMQTNRVESDPEV
jgi:hypothetical protein